MDDLLQTYLAARRIAELSLGYWTDHGEANKPWMASRLAESVNPYYYQTTGGLYLLMTARHGKPSAIWTPWGCWGCWGSGQRSEVAEKGFFSHLKLREDRQYRHSAEHVIYAVDEVEGKVLPAAELRERISYIPYDDAILQWRAMREQAQAS